MPDSIAQPQAAKLLNVSERGVRQAKAVLTKGVPELIEAVDRGDITVGKAASLVKQLPAVRFWCVTDV